MNQYKIPFNKPFFVGKELYYVAQAVLNGHIAGNGYFTKKCQAIMEERFSARKVLLTHSCTAALEMAAILCDIRSGDEVVMPSFTFVSTANAFFMRGARLIFVDIRDDTLNIDESKIEAAIGEKTKVIIPVHYAGVACDMNAIMRIAKKYNLYVVEDAAQSVNSKYKDQYLGTFGDLGAYSFHETKNIISGEGGALVVNNEKFVERAEIVREKGTNRSKFLRGEVDKYTWVDIGSSYLPSDLIAAFLFAQLENLDQINKKRSEIFDYYYKALMPLVNDGKIRLPFISSDCDFNGHLLYIVLKDRQTRDQLMDYLKSKGILSVFHYIPLHLSKVGLAMGYRQGQLPITESMSGRLLRLPFYYEIEKQEQADVVDAVRAFFDQRPKRSY